MSCFRWLSLLATSAGLCLAAEPPSVILISIDTLRADHLSAYGYRRIRTPNIDSFAQRGTLLSNIESQVPLTLPSHTSLFTSTYPFENQIEENAERVPPGRVTLASVLKSHGYKTAAFIGSVFLESEMGLDQGFDVYDSPFHFEAFSPISGSMFFGGASRNQYAVRDRRDGALVLGAARRWLAANRDASVFVFAHLFDLHKPYIRGGYDAELAYTDRILGAFKQSLIQSGWWQRSLVVLLSDHGESLGEHGEDSHGYFIYESTLRVPLIMHWPDGAADRHARDERPGALMDVAPTVLDCLRIAAPPSFEGRSLLDGSAPRGVYSESLYAYDGFGWAPLRSLRDGAYKYIDAPGPELYNLSADPHERINLNAKDPARARELKSELRKLLASHAPKQPASPAAISPRTRALLASLGYLSGGPRQAAPGAMPDPKDRLAEYRLYEGAQSSLYSRRLEEAAATFRQILARDPKNTLARRDLGGTYVEQHLYGKARECFEQVVASAPDDYMAQFELGIADKRLGLIKEALEHLQAACKVAPEAEQCRRELDALGKDLPSR
ncbi:MAG TPA: sulfatase-like hydrolase/transferase [Bryobacteraceae bacterium]|jgi:choline-sulfatase|nr:sulfatase-like hydrolase/transferase [Bryobacteraceae bacterium]